MNTFADELQLDVLSCLGVFERFKLSCVSKRWRKLITWKIPVAVDLRDDNFWNLRSRGWQVIGHLVREIENFPPERRFDSQDRRPRVRHRYRRGQRQRHPDEIGIETLRNIIFWCTEVVKLNYAPVSDNINKKE